MNDPFHVSDENGHFQIFDRTTGYAVGPLTGYAEQADAEEACSLMLWAYWRGANVESRTADQPGEPQ